MLINSGIQQNGLTLLHIRADADDQLGIFTHNGFFHK
jgi:hypothetical protein